MVLRNISLGIFFIVSKDEMLRFSEVLLMFWFKYLINSELVMDWVDKGDNGFALRDEFLLRDCFSFSVLYTFFPGSHLVVVLLRFFKFM